MHSFECSADFIQSDQMSLCISDSGELSELVLCLFDCRSSCAMDSVLRVRSSTCNRRARSEVPFSFILLEDYAGGGNQTCTANFTYQRIPQFFCSSSLNDS